MSSFYKNSLVLGIFHFVATWDGEGPDLPAPSGRAGATGPYTSKKPQALIPQGSCDKVSQGSPVNAQGCSYETSPNWPVHQQV